MKRSHWLCAVVLATIAILHHPSARAEDVNDLYQTRRAQIEKAAQTSADLRRRVMFSAFPVLDADGRKIHESTPLRDLLDAARGSTDPLVLQLLLDRCRTASRRDPACDDLDLARRWVQAETENQAAWIAYATALEANGDRVGAEEAWQRAGRASIYRDSHSAVLRAIVQLLPVESDPQRRHVDLGYAFGIAAATPVASYQDAYRGCKVLTRREACARIADVMWRDADNLLALTIAKWITAYAAQSDGLVRTREERIRAMQWALLEMNGSIDNDAIEAGDRSATVAANRAMEALVKRGELASAQDFLTQQRLSIAEAALRDAGWRAKATAPGR